MSANYQCRSCNSNIALSDVNVASDIALCRACGKTMSFSEIAPIPGSDTLDLSAPPKGVRIEENIINGATIVFKKISPIVFFLIPFMAIWSGGSMYGIYGKQIRSGHFDPSLSLFGIPFLIGTLVMLTVILFGLFGRWQISFPGGSLQVVLKMGPIGWTRRHTCDHTTRVSIKQNPRVQVNNAPQRLIYVETQGKTLKFGTPIPDEAKNFIAEFVRRKIHSV